MFGTSLTAGNNRLFNPAVHMPRDGYLMLHEGLNIVHRRQLTVDILKQPSHLKVERYIYTYVVMDQKHRHELYCGKISAAHAI